MTDLNKAFKSLVETDRAPVVICDPDHVICYMNPAAEARYERWGGKALLGQSLFDCHNERSRVLIQAVVDWFKASEDHNLVYTLQIPEEETDVYMVALRDDDGQFIAYYEKMEYRGEETMQKYELWT